MYIMYGTLNENNYLYIYVLQACNASQRIGEPIFEKAKAIYQKAFAFEDESKGGCPNI